MNSIYNQPSKLRNARNTRRTTETYDSAAAALASGLYGVWEPAKGSPCLQAMHWRTPAPEARLRRGTVRKLATAGLLYPQHNGRGGTLWRYAGKVAA